MRSKMAIFFIRARNSDTFSSTQPFLFPFDKHAPGSLTRGDHKGCSDSVEQAHCTLGAVKRYRALSEGGGLPNFWFSYRH